MDYKKMPKNAKKFECKLCDFSCVKNSNWNNHLLTDKHIELQMITKKCHKMPVQTNPKKYICNCSFPPRRAQSCRIQSIPCRPAAEVWRSPPLSAKARKASEGKEKSSLCWPEGERKQLAGLRKSRSERSERRVVYVLII